MKLYRTNNGIIEAKTVSPRKVSAYKRRGWVTEPPRPKKKAKRNADKA